MNTYPRNLASRPLRIGIDARLWQETGVGRYIRNLVEELQKIDRSNQYVLFALSKDIPEIQNVITNPLFSVVFADIHWHSVKEQLAFPKILEKEKLDLVHFPYFSVPVWYKGKYVITIHDLILHEFPTGKASTKSPLIYLLKHRAYKYIMAKSAKNAAKIITVSGATEKEIIKHLHISEDKIVVTYEGVDNKITSEKLRVKNLPGKYFLYVGNAYPHKNLERLIEAFSQSSKVLNTKLLLVGKKDYFYTRLERKVESMGLGNSVLFLHNVSDGELAGLYGDALALVMPSRMEGFGLPVLEAMQRGCLVAAANIEVFREIAGDIPVYFEPTDVNELANVLESIATGRIKNAKEKKEKGIQHAKKYSWQKMARQTYEVYQSCLGI